MSNERRFKELLKAYLEGKAGSTEYLELLQWLKSGRFDPLLKQQINDMLGMEQANLPLPKEKSAEILANIFSAEEHMARLIPVSRTRTYWRRAAAIAAVGILALAIWWMLPAGEVPANETAQQPANESPADSSIQGKKYIRLEDGSTVLLNQGSRLDYPENFEEGKREVSLVGEGYFDIQHDASRPFIVRTGEVRTTVLGTAFNIKAYPAQKEITVTVTRGKVRVSDQTRTIGVIEHDESLAIDLESRTVKQGRVHAEDVVSWKKQYLVFDDISVEDAATLIEEKYHVNISFSNEAIRHCHISATFLNDENLEQVMAVVAGVINATSSIQPNDQVIISGRGCISNVQ